MLLFAAGISAQTGCDYYKGKESVTAGGITYDISYSLSVGLQNTNNVYSNEANWYYQNGQTLKTEAEYECIEATTDTSLQARAIREAFGDIRIDILRRYYEPIMTILYVIGPDGSTLEVAFIMDNLPELVAIQPSRFARLETLLKKYVKWNVNESGKLLKFIHSIKFVNFHNVPTSDELISIEKNDDALGSDLVPLE